MRVLVAACRKLIDIALLPNNMRSCKELLKLRADVDSMNVT
jgi:hypothetical protein